MIVVILCVVERRLLIVRLLGEYPGARGGCGGYLGESRHGDEETDSGSMTSMTFMNRLPGDRMERCGEDNEGVKIVSGNHWCSSGSGLKPAIKCWKLGFEKLISES